MKKGLVTSGVLFYYWTLMLLAGVMTFKSVIESGYGIGVDQILPFTTATIWYPLIVGMFFLNCWADAKPRLINLDGKASKLS